jgi:general secretion pathway protein K
MKARSVSSGFALLLVLWTLVMLSAVALALAGTAGTEVRVSQDSWNNLQAERLAHSGHDFETYLKTRGIGTPAEDFDGLTVQPIVSGLKYRITLDVGTIDLSLEGENGKIDLSSADEDLITALFTTWTDDSNRAHEITASIADWVDPDDNPRPLGGESESYAGRGYTPRNSGLGSADLFLIKGMKPEDFVPAIARSDEKLSIRRPLSGFLTSVHTGNAINPNYSSRLVMQCLPGVTTQLVDSIIEQRQHSVFTSVRDFRDRTGLEQDSTLLKYFVFDRGTAPAVVSVGRLLHSTRVHVEKRTQAQFVLPNGQLTMQVLAAVDRDIPVE